MCAAAILPGSRESMNDPTIPRTISMMRSFCVDRPTAAVAHAVNGLPLLVHHVVVFEQVLTSSEVLRLDRLLRGRDAPGDQLRLDRHVFFHAEPQHQVLDALAAEDAQQIVLERKEKSRCARVALAAGAAAQLVVDAAGLVALGTDDVQAAQRTTSSCSPIRLLSSISAQQTVCQSGSATASCRDPAPHLLQALSFAMNSGLPPSRMSVPRPAMLVETVTAPLRPACATIYASRS